MIDPHEEYTFRCETCGERFASQKAYDKHMRELDELREGKITYDEYIMGDDE